MALVGLKLFQALFLLLMISNGNAQYADNSYDMNVPGKCNFAGILTVKTGQHISLYADGATANIERCKLSFVAEDSKANLEVSFQRLIIDDCEVHLTVTLEGYSNPVTKFECGAGLPGAMSSPTGRASFELLRDYTSARGYNYLMTLTAYIPGQDPTLTEANPIAVGLVVGITGGVIFFLVMMAIIGVCCYKKKKEHDRMMASYEYKARLDEPEMSTTSYSYANEVTGNGEVHGNYDGNDTPKSDKRLLMNDGYPESPVAEKTSPLMGSYATSPKKLENFRYNQPLRQSGGARRDNAINEKKIKITTGTDDEQESDIPKSPILAALHGNPRFRASFAANEAEAEERRKRISSHTSDEHETYSESGASFAGQANKTPPAPPLPSAPKSPRGKRSAFASIKRAPRPSSSGSEIEHIQRGYNSDEGDEDIRVLHDSDNLTSPSELVPIKVHDPQAVDLKPTSHTLRPNRGKSPQNKRKVAEMSDQKPISKAEYEPAFERALTRPAGGFQKNASGRKKSHRQPRIGRIASRSTGSIIDDDRPMTPNRLRDEDDLDNFAPLERSQSKQSLYSSRSSLYGRRRRRERRNSFGESVSTYTRDDIDAYDDYVIHSRPISRRDKYDRGFKSLGDLEYEMREQSTQTLRETATQTGKGHAVVMNPKRTVDKKPFSKHTSSSSTQTNKKPRKDTETESRPRTPKPKTKSVDLESEQPDEQNISATPKKKKSASVSSTAKADKPKRKQTTDASSEAGDKPKPKPKPKPRRTTTGGSVDELSDANSKGSVEGVEQPNAYENIAIPPPGTIPYANQALPMTVPQMNAQYMGQPMYMPQYYGPGGIPMVAPYPMGIPPVAYDPNQQVPLPVVAAGGPPATGTLPSVSQAPLAVQHPQAPKPSTQSNQPPKSKWEMLCSLTDSADAAQRTAETESVTGSVFSNTAYPASTSASGQPHAKPYIPPGVLPGSGSAYPATDFVPPALSSHPSSNHSSEKVGSVASSNMAPLPSSNMYPRKSSWEALKELTDKQYTLTYGSNYEQSESNV